VSRLKWRLEGKYLKAAECLAQDREGLLAFYDLPAESWRPMRTTRPIASTCATLCARTDKTHLCLSRVTRLRMVFKLCQSATEAVAAVTGRA
jgi:putative transposase